MSLSENIIEIEIDDKAIASRLEQLAAKCLDLRPVMAEITGIMEASVEDTFASEGDGAWQELAEKTKAAREKKDKWPGKILQVQGDLASSIVSESGSNFARVGVAGSAENLGKAIAHQFGTDKAGRNKKVNIPQRSFLVVTEARTEEIIEVIDNYLNRG